MTAESATPQPGPFDTERTHRAAEVAFWRDIPDGHDTARARALRAGTAQPAPGFEHLAATR
jgi:hypothetical protein